MKQQHHSGDHVIKSGGAGGGCVDFGGDYFGYYPARNTSKLQPADALRAD